jgi:hypothetical protein
MSLQRFKVIRTALVAKGAVDPPVPVPNTVVKRSSTYNTAGSTSVGRSAAASAVLLLFHTCLRLQGMKKPSSPDGEKGFFLCFGTATTRRYLFLLETPVARGAVAVVQRRNRRDLPSVSRSPDRLSGE